LLQIDLSQITPLQALLKLNQWKEELRAPDEESSASSPKGTLGEGFKGPEKGRR
jgi:hypothetical protein